MTATQLVLAALLPATAIAGYVDYRSGHIPNRLVAVIAALGVVIHVSVYAALLREPGQSFRGLLLGAAANICSGALLCALVPLILFYFRAIGGGDVKLLASIGAFTGPVLGAQIELYAFVLAALYAPARLAYDGQLSRLFASTAVLIANWFLPKRKRRAVPAQLRSELRFGPAVFAGAALVTALHWSVL